MSAAPEQQLLAVLSEVAPDVDPAAIDREQEFRDQFDFDSMDLLNFATGIKRQFGLDVPDADLRELTSLARAMRYLQAHLPASG